jgi:hypothetical protein
MKSRGLWSLAALSLILIPACKPAAESPPAGAPAATAAAGGQLASSDDGSPPTIARIARTPRTTPPWLLPSRP